MNMKSRKTSKRDSPAQESVLFRIARKRGPLPTVYQLAMLAATMKGTPDEALRLWMDADALRDVAWLVRTQQGDKYTLAEVMDGLNIRTTATFKKLLAATLEAGGEGEDEVERLWNKMQSEGVDCALAYSLEEMHHERNSERGRANRAGGNSVMKRNKGKRRKPVK